MADINPAGFQTPGLPNQGYRVWLALVIMVITSGLFVCARIASRISMRQMGPDDYVILASLCSCVVQTSLWGMAVRSGYGADYLKLDQYHRRLFNKFWFLGGIFYPITIALFKTSVILLNKRIFVQRGFQILCWVALLVNTCWAVGNTMGWLFQCVPIPIMWGEIPLAEGRCFNLHGLWVSMVAWDVSSDIFIMGMAVPMVWQLRLRFRDKVLLTGIFSLGAVVVVFSIMSCSAVVKGLKVEHNQANKYSFALANLMQVLESNMGIIVACLPVLRQPLIRYLPRLFGAPKDSGVHPPYYTDDRFADHYVMQNTSDRQRKGIEVSWHNVSVSGPELFKPSRRRSDELRIIDETGGVGEDRDGPGAVENGMLSRAGIRKDVVVSVNSARDYGL